MLTLCVKALIYPEIINISDKLNQTLSIKPKKGAVILVGGGDGNPSDAYKTACTLLRHINVKDIFLLVGSFNTNKLSALEDETAISGIANITNYLNNQFR